MEFKSDEKKMWLEDENGKVVALSCSYSIRWFSKHPEYADVLADPEGEAIKAAALAGPACGIRRP